MKTLLIKTGSNTLSPANIEEAEKLKKIKVGRVIEVELTQKRNYEFHKKFFAMLGIGFDAFEPAQQEYNGIPAQKNFERFREDVVIAAGFYDLVYDIKGNAKAKAHSISFGSMDQGKFEKVYNGCCNALLQQVLKNYTREDLDRVVDELIRF